MRRGVETSGVKVKHPRVFVGVLRYSESFMEVGRSSVDKVEWRFTSTVKIRTVIWDVKG